MKVLLATVALFFGFAINAQHCEPRVGCGPANFFESTNGMTYDYDTKVMVMFKADYSDEKITICQADRITSDQSTNEMVVENAERLEFFGVISSAFPFRDDKLPIKLRYKIGESIAYLE